MGKRLIWIALAIFGIGAIVYTFMPRPVFVETVVVGHGPLQVDILEEGKTRIIDRFVVSAPVAGFAHRIELDVGDPVKSGEVLLQLAPQRSRVLDPRSRAEAKARVAAAKATLSAAQEKVAAVEAEAKFVSATSKRLKKLYDEGLTSQETIDEAEAKARITRATLRSAKFSVKVAQFKLEEAQTALRYSAAEENRSQTVLVSIKAPVDGKVLKIIHQSEGAVREGQALIEIGNPKALEVEADVLSADAVRIQAGMKVFFERWGGNVPLKGHVRVIEPAGFTKVSALGVEEQRVLVLSEIDSPNKIWEKLGDGFRVETRFILWERDRVLQVPTNTLFRFKEDWAVFIVETGKASRRNIEIGHQNGLKAEVVSGLTEGDVVITHPNDAIDDGTSIRID